MSDGTERIWTCKIGGEVPDLPPGSDLPMRKAIERAFREITGCENEFLFSGWGASLTEPERAVVEDRLPSQEYEDAWHARRAGLTDADEAASVLVSDVAEWLQQRGSVQVRHEFLRRFGGSDDV